MIIIQKIGWVLSVFLISNAAFAVQCLAPGQPFECVQAECPSVAGVESGQEKEVIAAERKIRVRATGSLLNKESSSAEVYGVIVEPQSDLFLRAHVSVTYAGFLTGFSGGAVNFGAIEVNAVIRDLISDEIVDSEKVVGKKHQGGPGQDGPIAFQNFFPGSPAQRDVPFEDEQMGARLEAGRLYGIGISAQVDARGVDSESDYFSNNNRVVLNSLKLITWPDSDLQGFEDSDGDGLVDVWETNGIQDCDGNVLLALQDMGADLDRKDIFVELDWMAGREPSRRAIQTVKDSFAAAPMNAGGINNSDFSSGINLWVDTGSLINEDGDFVGDNLGGGNEISVTDIPDPTGEFIPPLIDNGSGSAYEVDIDNNAKSDFYEVKQKNFDLIRTRVFRYSISAKGRDEENNDYPDGQAEIGGDDSIGFSRLPVVLMHELGHNLNLDHGGDEGVNCKPNYVSIMNYAFVRGIPRRTTNTQNQDINNNGEIDAKILDFSPPRFPNGRGSAPIFSQDEGLNESDLSQTLALDPTDNINITRFFLDGDGRDLNLDDDPDWDGDINTFDNVPVDINSTDSISSCSESPELGLSELTGHDDWSAIVLPIEIDAIVGHLADNEGGQTPVPEERDPDEDEANEIEALFNTIDLSVSKSVEPELIMAGQAMTYNITVNNDGPNTALEGIIEDQLPEFVSALDLPDNCSVNDTDIVSCKLGPIAAGESESILLSAQVSPRLPCDKNDTVQLLNQVTVRNGDWPDINPADNSASVINEALCLRFEYAAKFICGEHTDSNSLFVAPGRYSTIVNIHNFQSKTIPFFKKLAIAFPPAEQQAGDVFPISIDELEYDEALKADCEDIRQRLFDGNFPEGFLEGYLVVQSPRKLDVDAFYSVASPSNSSGQNHAKSIDIEKIDVRDLRTKLSIEKTSDVFPIPFGDGLGSSQLQFFALLFTVKVFNDGAVYAQNLVIDENLSLLIAGPAVGALFVPDDPLELPVNATIGPISNTPAPPTVNFKVSLEEIAPDDGVELRFWSIVSVYLSTNDDSSVAVTLMNRAEISSQGPDISSIDNKVETIDNLIP